MGMDLCYYGVKEEKIPKILDGNFEEDFTNLKPWALSFRRSKISGW